MHGRGGPQQKQCMRTTQAWSWKARAQRNGVEEGSKPNNSSKNTSEQPKTMEFSAVRPTGVIKGGRIMKPRCVTPVVNKAVAIRISPRGKKKRQRRESLDKLIVEECYDKQQNVIPGPEGSAQWNSNGTSDKPNEEASTEEMGNKSSEVSQEMPET